MTTTILNTDAIKGIYMTTTIKIMLQSPLYTKEQKLALEYLLTSTEKYAQEHQNEETKQ